VASYGLLVCLDIGKDKYALFFSDINKGVHQGCPLSPTPFNVYLDEIITKWQKQDITEIKL